MSQKQALIEPLQIEKSRRSAYYFITTYCKTVDERDGRLKLFPKMASFKKCSKCGDTKELTKEEAKTLEFGVCPKCQVEYQVPYAYLKVIADTWQNSKNILIPKTRQMMVSWLCILLHLWLALFHDNQHIIFQSQTEEKAKELIKRLNDVWMHLPESIKNLKPLAEPPSQTQFKWKHGSRIRSVPQGATQVTGLTITALLSDEMGIQIEAEEAYNEARPALAGGGRFTGVSTPNGKGFFFRLVEDKLEGEEV